MSKSVFNKGMVAGARPFEEKFQKQAEKFETIAKNINQKLDDMSEMNDFIINELNTMEKKRLYDLNTVVDIAELGEDEKELLLAVLYTLANMSEQITPYQQTFLRSVKNYLQITNGQTVVDLAAIENMESINDQKAILQVVMEFLFLQNASHSYMDEYSEIMDYFSVNKRGVREIQECIDRIYKATGLQGVAENYGYVPEEPEETEVNQEQITKDYSSFEKQKITEKMIVPAGEVKTLEHLNLMFEDCIHVEAGGTLHIKNCSIKAKRSLDTAISSDRGEITLDGCVVDYYGLDGKQFFTLQNSKLLIQNTELIDCHRLLADSSDESVIEMYNCYSNALGIGVTHNMRTNHLSLVNCKFTSSNDGSGDYYKFNNRQCAFNSRDLNVKNCSFTDFKYGVFEIVFPFFGNNSKDAIRITESEFIASNGVIDSSHGIKPVAISKCNFVDCIDVFTGGGTNEETPVVFTDCQLVQCRGLIGNGSGSFQFINTIMYEGFLFLQTSGRVSFENCEMSNWNLTKVLSDLHAYNYSKDIAIEVGFKSVFKGCKFSNIDTRGSDHGVSDYFIGGNSNGASIVVDSCEFENILVNNEMFRKVKHYTLYTGTIFTRAKQKSSYTQIEIRNCQGIENTI